MKYPRKETEALVLSSNPFGDNSARINLAGPEGVFSVRANHVYRPNSPLRPLLRVGSFVSIQYRTLSDSLNSAVSLHVRRDSSSLWLESRTISFLMFLSELSSHLFRYGDSFPVEEVKRLISGLLDGKDLLSVSLLRVGQFFKMLGLKRDTSSCVSCGATKEIVDYSFSEGGFLCKSCALKQEDKRDAPVRDLYVLKFAFLDINPGLLDKKVPFANGRRILSQRVNYLTNYFDLKPLQSWAIFQSSLVGGL